MTAAELERYSQYIDRDRLEYIDRQQQLFDEAQDIVSGEVVAPHIGPTRTEID
jgi:hypothetical protein